VSRWRGRRPSLSHEGATVCSLPAGGCPRKVDSMARMNWVLGLVWAVAPAVGCGEDNKSSDSAFVQACEHACEMSTIEQSNCPAEVKASYPDKCKQIECVFATTLANRPGFSDNVTDACRASWSALQNCNATVPLKCLPGGDYPVRQPTDDSQCDSERAAYQEACAGVLPSVTER
jgi:hypothetical protein